jgi:hypothetical protein
VLNVRYPRRYLAFFYGKPTAFVHLRMQQGDAGEGICGRRGARLLLNGVDKLFGLVAVFFCRRFMSKSLDAERHGRHAVRSGEAELPTCWPLGESAASVHLASIVGRTVIEATPISSPTRPLALLSALAAGALLAAAAAHRAPSGAARAAAKPREIKGA